MRIPSIPAKLLVNVTNSAQCALDDILRHFQESAPGTERDQLVIQQLHAELLRTIDGVIRQELHKLNPTIWNVPSLPDELWSEIWGHLAIRDCLAVSHVCRDWRNLALSSSTLWSDIDFQYCCNAYAEGYTTTCRMDGSPHRKHGGRTDGWTDRYSLFTILKRGTAPLRFSLTISGAHWECAETILLKIAKTIKPHARRIIDLTIIDNEQQFDLPLFLAHAGFVFPNLVHLTARGNWEDAEDDPSEAWNGVHNRLGEFQAPLLRTADLDIESPWLQALVSRAQISNLRNATLCPSHYTDVLGILHSCPHLRSLDLNFKRFSYTDSVWSGTVYTGIDHPLEDLRMTNLPFDDSNPLESARFLDVFLQPSRRSIQVTVPDDDEFNITAFLRTTAMFADLFGEQGTAVDATLTVAIDSSGTTVNLSRPWASTSHTFTQNIFRRRLLTFNWTRNLSAALRSIWKAMDVACIRTFELNVQTPHLPPFPPLQPISGDATGHVVLPKVERFTIILPHDSSLVNLRAIDWGLTVPKTCEFEVRLVYHGKELNTLTFGHTCLFVAWLLGDTDNSEPW